MLVRLPKVAAIDDAFDAGDIDLHEAVRRYKAVGRAMEERERLRAVRDRQTGDDGESTP